jgi:hypothetical protein
MYIFDARGFVDGLVQLAKTEPSFRQYLDELKHLCNITVDYVSGLRTDEIYRLRRELSTRRVRRDKRRARKARRR